MVFCFVQEVAKAAGQAVEVVFHRKELHLNITGKPVFARRHIDGEEIKNLLIIV